MRCGEHRKPKAMIKYITSLPLESVVDVKVIVSLPAEPIASATVSNVELQIEVRTVA
jgi:hypothetical protein